MASTNFFGLPLNFDGNGGGLLPVADPQRQQPQRDGRRPFQPNMVPWEHLEAYLPAHKPQRRRPKPISSKTAKRRKRNYNQRSGRICAVCSTHHMFVSQLLRAGAEALREAKRSSARK